MPSYGLSSELQDYSTSKMQLTTTESDIGIYRKKGCCGGRSSLEKVLLLVVILTLAAAIAACIAVAVVVQQNGSEESEISTLAPTAAPIAEPTTPEIAENADICLTPGCVAAAARVNEYIDPSVHPCDNFFQYACGNWIKKHPIPEDRSSIDTFGVLRDEVEVILKDLLEKSSNDEEIGAITKSKRLYASCINESQIEDLGLDPVQSLYRTVGLSFPLVDPSWDEASFDLVNTLIDVREYSYQPLIRLYINTDSKDSSARIIYCVVARFANVLARKRFVDDDVCNVLHLPPKSVPNIRALSLSCARTFVRLT